MASHTSFGAKRRNRRVAPARRAVAYALLLGECVVILVPSIYGRATPKLFGIPFFYWFQLLWIIVGMVVTGIAYLLVGQSEPVASGESPDDGTGAGR